MAENQAAAAGENKLLWEALLGEFTRVVRLENESLHERLDRLEEERARQPQPERQRAQPRARRVEEITSDSDGERDRNQRRGRRQVGDQREDDNLGGIKLQIPPFHGKSDPDSYFDWERRVDFIFDCNNYSERKKVRLAAIEFTDYALIWWNQFLANVRKGRERQVSTWEDMKILMRKRFVPSHYQSELYQRLQGIRQGARSVEDYFKEMETLLLRINIEEDEEATKARFLLGLSREIRDRVELQQYDSIEEMVHMAEKVERQLKRGGKIATSFGASKREESTIISALEKPKEDPKPEVLIKTQGKAEGSHSKARDIKCFKCQGRGHIAEQCPSKQTFLLRDDGEIVPEDENDMPPLEDIPTEEIYAVQGPLLVLEREVSELSRAEWETQRTNIFHTLGYIGGKEGDIIIDSGSCTNIASATMVQELKLPLFTHPRPYKLQWFDDKETEVVKQQVLVTFRIGQYQDAVLCDVAPMQVCQLLLGRPWQFDRRVKHDGFSNVHTVMKNGRKFFLLPMTPTQLSEAQAKKRKRFEIKEEWYTLFGNHKTLDLRTNPPKERGDDVISSGNKLMKKGAMGLIIQGVNSITCKLKLGVDFSNQGALRDHQNGNGLGVPDQPSSVPGQSSSSPRNAHNNPILKRIKTFLKRCKKVPRSFLINATSRSFP